MITYVNTVLVGKAGSTLLTEEPAAASSMATPSADAGKFIIMNCDLMNNDPSNPDKDLIYKVDATTAATVNTIKVGIVTKKNTAVRVRDNNGVVTTEYRPIIKWSNEIKAADIKSFSTLSYQADTEDEVEIDFTGLDSDVEDKWGEGGKRIIVRLTFKDMPHRYRKWTESYEYVTKAGDDAAKVATGITNLINNEWKRARVSVEASGKKVTITALPYDDDDNVNSLNWANKVRFNVNVYWTDPYAEGWAALNKNYPDGVVITKTPGKTYPASAKLVRDREAQAMGYLGILNHGSGTWPIIQPDMETDLGAHYDAITLEFENMYRAADDIFRKTKQTVEIYGVEDTLGDLQDILAAFCDGSISSADAGQNTAIAGKQAALSTDQLAAANSGITAEKVAAYDALVEAAAQNNG